MAVEWKKIVTESSSNTIAQNTSGSAASLSATLAVTSGGTGLASIPKGSLIHADGANSFAALSGGVGDGGKVVSYNEDNDLFELIDAGTATNATNVTVTDNESTNENNLIAFVADAATTTGNHGLEMDGDLTYNPSTGRLTATQLAGTLQTAAQSNITSLGTLTTLTVDNVIVNGTTIGHTSDTDLMTLASGVLTVAGELDATSLDISGDADIDGTLEADAITVNGTALNTVIAGVTVDNATTAAVATTVTITDNENTNEENAIVFTAGGDVDGGNLGLESDGDLTYNPSTGTLSATVFKGNIDAVNGDFDGTLEADAITVGGTALNTVIAGVTVDNATTAAVATTVTITDNESTNEDNAIIFAAGGDVDGGNLGLESDGTLTYNPSTGKVTATGFVGALTGNADTVTTSASSSSNAHFIAMVPNASGSQAPVTDAGLKYTPSSDTLTVTNLTVSGTTTTVNTTDLEVTDKIIRVANNGTDAATVSLAGMEIDTEDSTQLPFIGFKDGAALTEMILRKEGATDDFPIAVMRHAAGAPDVNSVNAGKGTFYYDTSGNDLYLQVNV